MIIPTSVRWLLRWTSSISIISSICDTEIEADSEQLIEHAVCVFQKHDAQKNQTGSTYLKVYALLVSTLGAQMKVSFS